MTVLGLCQEDLTEDDINRDIAELKTGNFLLYTSKDDPVYIYKRPGFYEIECGRTHMTCGKVYCEKGRICAEDNVHVGISVDCREE